MIAARSLERTGLARAGFTTRLGGVSRGPYRSLNLSPDVGDDGDAVSANRARFGEVVGMQPADVVEAEQVHGNRIAVVASGAPARWRGPLPGVDGLVTAQAGVWLVVYAADCVPALMLDPETPAVAAVHAGWRGTATGAVAEALSEMRRRFGTDPARVVAALGPAIGGCCYEVDAPVARAMEAHSWWPKAARCGRPGRWHLDLRVAIRGQLRHAGIPAARIATVGGCTACRSDLFFSYRRDRVTGRMAGYISLTGAARIRPGSVE